MRSIALITAIALALPTAGLATDDDDEPGFGVAGLLSGSNKEDLPPIILSAGEPIAPEGPWKLKSGTYYEFEIQGDGSQELALVGPEFFRLILRQNLRS